MLCHAVTYRFKDSVGEAEIAEVVARLAELPDVIEEIRSYRFGPDLGLTEGADFAIVAEFDDADGWRAYQEHPATRSWSSCSASWSRPVTPCSSSCLA